MPTMIHPEDAEEPKKGPPNKSKNNEHDEDQNSNPDIPDEEASSTENFAGAPANPSTTKKQPAKDKRKFQLDLFGYRSRRPPHKAPRHSRQGPKSLNATVQLGLVDTIGRSSEGYGSLHQTDHNVGVPAISNPQKASIQIDFAGEGCVQVDLNGDVVKGESQNETTCPPKQPKKKKDEDIEDNVPAITPTPSPQKERIDAPSRGKVVVDLLEESSMKSPRDNEFPKKAPVPKPNVVDLTTSFPAHKTPHDIAKLTRIPYKENLTIPKSSSEVVDLFSVTPPVPAHPNLATAKVKTEPSDSKGGIGQQYKTVPVRGFRKSNGTFVHPHQRRLKSFCFNHPLKESQNRREKDSTDLAMALERDDLSHLLGLIQKGAHPDHPREDTASVVLACQLRIQEIEEYQKRQENRYV